MATYLTPVKGSVTDRARSNCIEVVDKFPDLVPNVWGYASFPDHNNRRCIDFMIRNKAGGDTIAAYLWEHRKRLGVELIIWNRRIRRTYRKGSIAIGVWAKYSGPSPHTDHVHVQFAPGAYQPPVEPKTITMYAGPDGVQGYKIKNGVGVKSTAHLRKPGHKLTGTKGTRSDGAYLVTPFGTWYPMDDLTDRKPDTTTTK